MTFKLDSLSVDPVALASQGNGILGIRDSGKSYSATFLAEQIFAAGIPFVAFDPIGVWRFLRTPGKGPGIPVVVAGGMHGDLPLDPENAPHIVRAAMQSGVSIVLDLYSMEMSKSDWRKIVRDCVRVLLYENGRYGLRHVFIEEAAEFAPQKVTDGLVYAEIEKLARMGGNARLGYTLINQRAEEVNKAVLELCDNLFLHRQKGKNSLLSLGKWLDVANVKPPREITDSLPTLPQGKCWCWLAGTERPVLVQVPEKNSFHPDRRAVTGDATHNPGPSVDVGEFVKALRKALADKAAAQDDETKDWVNPTTYAEAEMRGYARGYTDAYLKGVTALGEFGLHIYGIALRAITELEVLRDVSYDMVMDLEGIEEGIKNGTYKPRIPGVTAPEDMEPFPRYPKEGPPERPEGRPEPHTGVDPANGPDVTAEAVVDRGKLTSVRTKTGTKPAAGADGLLAVAARHWPAVLTWSQIAALAGRKPRGGHFNTSRKYLIDSGLVTESDHGVIVTDAGFEKAGGKPEQPGNLLRAYIEALPNPADRMLQALVDSPQTTTEKLGRALNLKPHGGHWNTGLSTLERCNLIKRNGNTIMLLEGALES